MGGLGGSMWMMGEWSVGHWIVGVISFQKMYGLYGLKHHIVEIICHQCGTNEQTTSEYRATQLLICEKLSLAIPNVINVINHLQIKSRLPSSL